MRHRYTHKVTIHQLGLKVEGWQEIDPVTVDRVGVYFRLASPDYSSAVSIILIIYKIKISTFNKH